MIMSLDYVRPEESHYPRSYFLLMIFRGGALHKSERNRIVDEDENLALIFRFRGCLNY